MATTISDLEIRLDLARRIQAEYTGESDDGLDVERIGEYTLIYDGNDRWLTESDDYDSAIETIIGEICEGDYTSNSMMNADEADAGSIYRRLCELTICLFSRVGISLYSAGDLAENLDCSEEQKSEILAWLGIENSI